MRNVNSTYQRECGNNTARLRPGWLRMAIVRMNVKLKPKPLQHVAQLGLPHDERVLREAFGAARPGDGGVRGWMDN